MIVFILVSSVALPPPPSYTLPMPFLCLLPLPIPPPPSYALPMPFLCLLPLPIPPPPSYAPPMPFLCLLPRPSYASSPFLCPSYASSPFLCPSYASSPFLCPSYASSPFLCPSYASSPYLLYSIPAGLQRFFVSCIFSVMYSLFNRNYPLSYLLTDEFGVSGFSWYPNGLGTTLIHKWPGHPINGLGTP